MRPIRRPRMSSKHNFWGGLDGPPGPIPIVDPREVWADESLQTVLGVRLNPDQLRVAQEAIGREPLGRYGDFPNGSDYFWAFPTEAACKAAMERESAAISALRPRPEPPETSDQSQQSEEKSPDTDTQNVPAKDLTGYEYPELQNMSDDEMQEHAGKLGIDYTDLLFMQLCDGP